MPADSQNYEIWQTRQLLAVMQDTRQESWFFQPWFPNELRSDDEWIDFEKLPLRSRQLAPLVLPLGRGRGVYSDRVDTFRFKPAYTIVEEAVDPLRPLTRQPGVDRSMLEPVAMTPSQRLQILKANMAGEAVLAIQRLWEWMRARAIIDGQYTLVGVNYPSVTINFQRASGHTEVLGAGARYGDPGVSILDHIQGRIDTMNNAPFGGFCTTIVMGSDVWRVMRKDTELLRQMDLNTANGRAIIERGLVSGGPNGGKVYKVGELMVGGASGARIEMWVNDETFTDSSGATQRYLGLKEMCFIGSPDNVQGHQCFGRIVDSDAQYAALPIFPKNFTVGWDVKTEHLSFKSAPLMVPINPNATMKSTVLAP